MLPFQIIANRGARRLFVMASLRLPKVTFSDHIVILTWSFVSEPNSEYVISLRASNGMGDGPAKYESVRTRDEAPPEPVTPLIPPVGLKAIVLSSSTVVVYWTDSTLSQSQVRFIYNIKLSTIYATQRFVVVGISLTKKLFSAMIFINNCSCLKK